MRKEKRHDDVERTHMNHIIITRPSGPKSRAHPHSENRDIYLATSRPINQEHINEIAAHVRHVEATHTAPKPKFNYWSR